MEIEKLKENSNSQTWGSELLELYFKFQFIVAQFFA